MGALEVVWSKPPPANAREAVMRIDEPLMLGSQFRPAVMPHGRGERLLCAAMLEQAQRDLRVQRLDGDKRGIHVGMQAEDWVAGMGPPSWPFTFRHVCEALGLSPEWVRRHLTAGTLRWPRSAARSRSPQDIGGTVPYRIQPTRVRIRKAPG